MNVKMEKKYVCSWNDIPLFIDVAYVSIVLGLSENSIRKLCASGETKATKVGDKIWRIAKSDLAKYMGQELT